MFSPAQLAAVRNTLWRMNDPLLTLEAARDWLSQTGIVLFTPRPQQLPVPAPSFVAATRSPDTADDLALQQALALLGRLITEGAAVPLNLLGGATDQPDFVCSPQAFSFVYTLRGDKGWKQPPQTSGAASVSPLAVNAFQELSQHGSGNGGQTAAQLASALGKEITAAAALRALAELWAQLRVIPVPQADNSVQWELVSHRFTRQIKSGANAGQPTAISALLSLVLDTAVAYTAEELEVLLSPLASRSRIRDVIHGLTATQQLESIVVEGRILLYLAGGLPEFPVLEATEISATSDESTPTPAEAPSPPELTHERIGRFTSSGRFDGNRPQRRSVGRKTDERERRPFSPRTSPRTGTPIPRTGAPANDFSRPWDETSAKPEAAAAPPVPPEAAPEASEAPPTRKPYVRKPRFDSGDGRPPRKSFADKPRRDFDDRKPAGKFSDRKPAFGAGKFGDKKFADRKPAFGDKPHFRDGDARPPRKSFAGGDGRPPRKFFSDKPPRDFGDKKFGGPKKFGDRKSAFGAGKFGDRKPVGKFGDRKPFGDKPAYGGSDSRPRKSFSDRSGPRPSGKSFGSKPRFGSGDARPPRKPFGDKPAYGGSDSKPRKPFGDRKFSDKKPAFDDQKFGPKKFAPRKFDDKKFSGAKKFGDRKSAFGAGKFGAKPAGKFSKSSKPSGKFAGKSRGPGKPRSTGPRSTAPRKPRLPEGESE
jgi:23S rRNA pseudouridine2605 synthase